MELKLAAEETSLDELAKKSGQFLCPKRVLPMASLKDMKSKAFFSAKGKLSCSLRVVVLHLKLSDSPSRRIKKSSVAANRSNLSQVM